MNGHALLDDALHSQQADAEGVLDQFAVGAYAAVAKVVGDVSMCAALVRNDQVTNNRGEIFARQCARCIAWQLKVHETSGLLESLRELVATDATKVVSSCIEEEILNERAGIVAGGWIAWSQSLVDFNERFATSCGRVLLQRVGNVRMLWVTRHAREEARNLVVRFVADRTQERGGGKLSLPVHLHVELILAARLELQPRAAIWNHLRGPERTTRNWIDGVGVEDSW